MLDALCIGVRAGNLSWADVWRPRQCPLKLAAIPPQSRISHVYSPVTLTDRPADIGVSVSDTAISPPEQLAPATPELAASDLARMVSEVSTERSKPGWASFSLELNDDQIEIRDWV